MQTARTVWLFNPEDNRPTHIDDGKNGDGELDVYPQQTAWTKSEVALAYHDGPGNTNQHQYFETAIIGIKGGVYYVLGAFTWENHQSDKGFDSKLSKGPALNDKTHQFPLGPPSTEFMTLWGARKKWDGVSAIPNQ